MSQPRKSANPFYALLIIVGTAFVLTACAYCVMALRGSNPNHVQPAEGPLALMQRHGLAILIVELALLAVATMGVMVLDEYADQRAKKERKDTADEGQPL